LSVSDQTLLRINFVEISKFSFRALFLKRFGRVKITNTMGINTLGLNTDNPTVYGRFKIVNDSLIIKTKYSIQHFNHLAPKRRVKKKSDKIYRFKVLENLQL